MLGVEPGGSTCVNGNKPEYQVVQRIVGRRESPIVVLAWSGPPEHSLTFLPLCSYHLVAGWRVRRWPRHAIQIPVVDHVQIYLAPELPGQAQLQRHFLLELPPHNATAQLSISQSYRNLSIY